MDICAAGLSGPPNGFKGKKKKEPSVTITISSYISSQSPLPLTKSNLIIASVFLSVFGFADSMCP